MAPLGDPPPPPPPPPSLLLLPPPAINTRLALSTAYSAPLSAVLAALATQSRQTRRPALLLVAVAAPILLAPSSSSSSSSPPDSTAAAAAAAVVRWDAAQALLAGVYSVIAALCAEHGIQSDMGSSPAPAPTTTTTTATATAPAGGSVDARVVLVDHDRRRDYSSSSSSRRAPDGSFKTHNGTAVLDLAGFATRVTGPWDRIFHPSSESGYELVRAYLALAEEGGPGRQAIRQGQIVPVPGGISMTSSSSSSSPKRSVSTTTQQQQQADASAADRTTHDDGARATKRYKSYETVILGGTFDHLHPGHKLLLHSTVLLMRLPEKRNAAASQQQQQQQLRGTLIIGVSGQPMLETKKFPQELESWDTRCRSVLSFLATTFNASPPSAAAAAIPTTTPATTTTTPDTTDTTDTTTANAPYRIEHVAKGPSGGEELHGIYADGTVLVRCTVLNDPFGPTVDEEPIGAICVSRETRGGGKAVNDRRAAKGWHALDAYEVDVLDTSHIVSDAAAGGEDDFSSKISSTVIRQQRAAAKAKAKAQI